MKEINEAVFLILMRLFLIRNTHEHYAPVTKTWIIKKWNFFKVDCLRSIKSQTNKNFKLVVLINKEFPYYYLIKDEVEREAATGAFDLQYVDFEWGDGVPFSHIDFHKYIASFTKEYINKKYPNCNWLITARLDGDDIIARNYVQKVWDINRAEEGWITFNKGYWFKDKNFIGYDTIRNAHLIYVEPVTDDIKTVYCRMHNKLGYQGPEDSRFTVVDDDSRWWADRVGEFNIKKDSKYIEGMKSFIHKLYAPIEEVKKEFDIGE